MLLILILTVKILSTSSSIGIPEIVPVVGSVINQIEFGFTEMVYFNGNPKVWLITLGVKIIC